MSLPRLIHSTIFSKMSVGYALKRNGCPFLDCSSMVFYRAIPSILIYIYVYSTRSFYRSLASNSLRISWDRAHRRRMPLEDAQAAPRSHLPQPHRLILAPREG